MMTIEQALKIKQKWSSKQARNDLERLLLRDERPANKVIALACKALEKQIPKKPIPKGKYHFSCPLYKNELGIAREDISVYDMTPPNFCENCGQDLDWSDTK